MADLSNDREARAERYFEQDLKDQREWYGRRASIYKKWTLLLSLMIVAAGAATSFLQIFTPATWVPPVTAALGALVALSEGWQRIARYDETWVAYRKVSEGMKREHRLYSNGAGIYRGLDDRSRFSSWSKMWKPFLLRSSRSTGAIVLKVARGSL
jgi:hypothetical protein